MRLPNEVGFAPHQTMETKLRELGEPLRDLGATSRRPHRHHANREASCSVGSRPSGVR
jgi:hypothetical protein